MHLLPNEPKANHRFALSLMLLLGLLSLILPLRHDPGRLALKPGENELVRRQPPSQVKSDDVVPITSPNASTFSPDFAPQKGLREAYGKIPLSFEPEGAQQKSSERFVARGSGFMISLSSTEAVFATAASRTPGQDRLAHKPVSRSDQAANPSPPDFVGMDLLAGNPRSHVVELTELEGKSNYFIGNDPRTWRINVPTYSKVRYGDVYPGIDVTYYGNGRQLEYDFIVSPGADPKSIRLSYTGAKIEINREGDLLLHTTGGEIRQRQPVVYQMIDQRRTEISGRYTLNDAGEVGFEIAAYDPNETLVIDPALVYSTYLGGSAGDIGYSVTVDSAGNAYVAGRTLSTNFPTVNPYRSTNSGLRDIFITKLNSTGTSILYSTYIGGTLDDIAYAVTTNSSGEAYLTGTTASTNFPLVSALQPFYGGGTSDGFFVKLNSAGNALLNATYAGGSGADVGRGIAVDNSGNTYGIGYTTSSDLLTVNALQPFPGGGNDAFVLELDASATSIVFSTYAGGSGDDFGDAIAVDASGYIYALGDTNSTDLLPLNAFQTSNAGGFDTFLAKVAPSGTSVVFATYAGGSLDDGGGGIAVDGAGNIYCSGFTNSTDLRLITNAIRPNKAANYDAFVAKLSPAGAPLYGTYLGGNGNEAGFSLAVSEGGFAYVGGETSSTDFPLVNSLRGSNSGGFDAFVTKLSPNGSTILFSSYLGGTSDDSGYAIACDKADNAYIAGPTTSTNFPTANPRQPAYAGAVDVFIAKIATIGRTKTGVFRPSTGELFLKNANSSGFADTYIIFGNPGDYPIAGDWNGDGVDSVGIYRNGVFYLRNTNTTGFADIAVPFGSPGDQPIAGDWNGDGVATIGIYRNGTFYLRNSNTAGPPDLVFTLGDAGDVGIAGDWNGDGITTCGVFRPSNGIVYLRNSNSTGFADLFFVFGNAGDKPVAGDWNGDGIDTVAIYRDGLFFLTNSNTTGFADIVFVLGNSGDFPIAGNWNGSP